MRESQFRNKVTWFSFAFSLMVVWIHSYNAELFLGKTEAMARVYRVEHWLGDGIGQIAVPGFFMISGYLFYRDFSWEKLRGKWQRRIHSVLVPYIVWNFLYYLGYVIGSRLPWVDQVVGKGVIPFGLAESVDAIINYTYNYVFWYLFQLILLILLAPVLYPVLRRLWSRILFLCCLWWMAARDIRLPLVNVDALIYYSTAASLAISCTKRIGTLFGLPRSGQVITEETEDFYKKNGKERLILGACSIGCAVAAYQIGLARCWAAGFVLCRLSAMAGLWLLVPAERLPAAGRLVMGSFFLYATHFAFVRFFNKAGARLLPAYPFIPLVLYLIMPLLVLGISGILGRFFRRFAPGVWNILNGGR